MIDITAGQQAETQAAEYLRTKGYKILDQNWKTPVCEIDIVAQKDKRIYFVEVKYRLTDSQGSGLGYITPKKLKRMKFAAEVWVKNRNWEGDYSLSAIELSGPAYVVTAFLPDLT